MGTAPKAYADQHASNGILIKPNNIKIIILDYIINFIHWGWPARLIHKIWMWFQSCSYPSLGWLKHRLADKRNKIVLDEIFRQLEGKKFKIKDNKYPRTKYDIHYTKNRYKDEEENKKANIGDVLVFEWAIVYWPDIRTYVFCLESDKEFKLYFSVAQDLDEILEKYNN